MPNLSDFLITQRWPAKYPDRLQLYSLPTPNGVKSITLEEIGLPYEVHLVDFAKGDQHTPEFLSLNPNGKIPAISTPMAPTESRCPYSNPVPSYNISRRKRASFCPAAQLGATLLSSSCISRWVGSDRCSASSASSTNSQAKRPLQRYVNESKRLLDVLETHLAGRQWIMEDEYSIADISMLGWVRNLIGFYEARELVGFDALQEVPAWLERGLARPAVQRGLSIPQMP
jgi:GSH-dependent disulfide-bond oxidoreductase